MKTLPKELDLIVKRMIAKHGWRAALALASCTYAALVLSAGSPEEEREALDNVGDLFKCFK